MNKPLLTAISICFTLLLLVSSSDRAMHHIFTFRENSTSLRSDNYYFGDLYGLSFLPQFKIKNDFHSSDVALHIDDRPRTIHLCIAGDSYLGNFFVKGPSQFCGVGKLDYLNMGSKDSKTVTLHAGDDNVMLIESVERNLRTLADTRELRKRFIVGQTTAHKWNPAQNFNTFLRKNIFNTNINQNLRFNLFDYRFFTRVRELRAAFNYRLFNRTSTDIFIPPDSKYLLYDGTVDPRSPTSSFSSVSDSSVELIVNSLNDVYDYYRKAGFNEVYFAPIPNPATVLYPALGEYNRLIARIVDHPRLKVPTFDVSKVFATANRQIFFTSDSHWNVNGFRLWLNGFNALLAARADTK